MNTRATLLRTVARRRFDILPRLVLADWLEENGDGTGDLLTAEFIRVGVELSSGADAHRPSVSCDCTRCKLRRRQTELFDLMAHVSLLTDSGFNPIALDFAFESSNYAGGFPAVGHARAMAPDPAGLPLAVGRVFLTLPVNFLTVRFAVFGGRPVRRETWQVSVSVTNSTDTRGGRVAATVGPVVGQNYRAAFSCEHPVDHASRVPTLVRKAVRRCLTNRTSNGERRATVPVPASPPLAEWPTMTAEMRTAFRRRGRR
jgi:uncharacterized protein (TIGR02996 family)